MKKGRYNSEYDLNRETNNPKTSDNIGVLLAALTVGLTSVITVFKKRK